MRRLLFLTGFLLVSIVMSAQQLEVHDFETLTMSAEARTNPVVDPISGRNCGLLIIKGNNIKEYRFFGKIIGEPDYSEGEVRLYMAPGANYLEVRSENLGNIDFDFNGSVILSQTVYTMTLVYNTERYRTLVMPVAALGKTTSFGAMIGIVKKFGGYVKGHSNFKSAEDDIECNEKGFTDTGNEVWFSGAEAQSRLAITGGLLYRVAKPLYLYGGLGYGQYTYSRQTSDGLWAKNIDSSVDGVEIEAGIMGRWKSLALSAGVETCQMKYWELNLGVGIFF